MGSLYRPRWKRKDGQIVESKIWHLAYYHNGKLLRESAKTPIKMVAKKLLANREGEIAKGKMPGIHFDKVTWDELAEDFLRDYRLNGRKSLERAEYSVARLGEHFKGWKVPSITSAAIQRYVDDRLKWICSRCVQKFNEHDGKCPLCDYHKLRKPAKNATINRELAALKRMLNLGAQQTPPKVDRVPYISMLKENNTRKGFYTWEEFQAVRANLPPYLQPFVTFAFKSGWRRGEIVNLTWSRVNLKEGTVRLEAGETKNSQARNYYLDEELRRMFQEQWDIRKKRGTLNPYVFPGRDGQGRIKDPSRSWKKACDLVGIPGRLFHDFRRTAVRNMIRAGISENVAMTISGHKTRAVFQRYNITSDEDLREASRKMDAFTVLFKGQGNDTTGRVQKLHE